MKFLFAHSLVFDLGNSLSSGVEAIRLGVNREAKTPIVAKRRMAIGVICMVKGLRRR